ncbi:MAG: hypothetical protein E7249_17510 [Paenibacillaceae bacterium]|nr:hypothetical protein [Paenibacillaceae bacterium]
MEKTVHNNLIKIHQIVINNFPHTSKNSSLAHISTMSATVAAQLHGLNGGRPEESSGIKPGDGMAKSTAKKEDSEKYGDILSALGNSLPQNNIMDIWTKQLTKHGENRS